MEQICPNQAVSECANVYRGRHHTYCTELQTDSTSCNGFTVAAKGQTEEEQGGCMKRKLWGRKRKEKEKAAMAVHKRRCKREDEMGGGGWQEGNMQIAQDLTGIFLDG
ncbi:hypothetical protein EXN66_Car019148 [Channa argus]|uniref:Uncharacterized protein n=1 Tax=Channa argus TaxID=215402 RepID=A0A6G1QL78_CHAAH|nr:hypothetical protein EXN66_Car019148 [Channa argus]